eukprot:1817740-Karenia_brevis.AAC.1
MTGIGAHTGYMQDAQCVSHGAWHTGHMSTRCSGWDHCIHNLHISVSDLVRRPGTRRPITIMFPWHTGQHILVGRNTACGPGWTPFSEI